MRGLQENTDETDFFAFLNIYSLLHISVKLSFYQAPACLSNELLLKNNRPQERIDILRSFFPPPYISALHMCT